jgi:hypothetical protein
MKNLLVVGFIVVTFTALTAQGKHKNLKHYPSYEEVMTEFYKNHSKSSNPATELRLEKRPKGWYVKEVDISAFEKALVSPQLFWELKTRKYRKLGYEAPKVDNDKSLQRALSNTYLARHFRIHPYWGYVGWQDDVIALLGKKKRLPDHLLYGLGRAYSSKATGLLSNHAGDFANPKHAFDLPDGPDTLSGKQLEKYLKYRLLACEKFKALHKQNPNFETIVGPIHTKYSNEYGTLYMDLLMFQNHQTALEHSNKEGLYDEFTLASAKNYLQSVAPNGILFTYGDNDTYPLWYVQYHLGIRPDVRVLNVSLLNLSRYSMTLRQALGESKAIPSSFSDRFIKNPELSYFILNEQEGNISLGDFLAEANTFEARVKGGEAPTLSNTSLQMSLSEGETIKWKLPNSRYIIKGDVIILDIIHNAMEEHPVYFATSSRNYLGLEDYLSLEGMAYRITGQSGEIPPSAFSMYSYGQVDKETLSENILEKFDFSSMHTRYAGGPVVAQYNLLFLRLAEAHLLSGEADKVSAVLDHWLEVMPDKHLPYGNMHRFGVEFYYRVNQPAKARALSQQILHNIEKSRGEFGESGESIEVIKKGTKEGLKRLEEEYGG